jgi:hypothetical protein
MHSSSVFATLLLAVPLATSIPTKVLPQVVPETSPYPLGDAYEHEFQYSGFDPHNEADANNLRALHHAFAQTLNLVRAGYNEANEPGRIFDRWFLLIDDENESDSPQVRSAFETLFDPEANNYQERIGHFVVINQDVKKACHQPDSEYITRAYTIQDIAGMIGWVHFCPEAFNLVQLDTIECGSLGENVEEAKMDSLSTTMVCGLPHKMVLHGY